MLQVEEAPGPVQASGPLESGGGDKTKPFVQGAVTVQDQDVGSGAPSRPAAAVPAAAGDAPRSDGGLVRTSTFPIALHFVRANALRGYNIHWMIPCPHP